MKLLPYPELPCFFEMTEVIRKNHIQCWQANDFWKKILSEFELEKTNINYQSVYRFLLRLERENFLIIDPDKNEMGCTTYSETKKMNEYRKKFCSIENQYIPKFENHYQILKKQLQILADQIEAIDELRKEVPLFIGELDSICLSKMKEINKIKNKLAILDHLLINELQHRKL